MTQRITPVQAFARVQARKRASDATLPDIHTAEVADQGRLTTFYRPILIGTDIPIADLVQLLELTKANARLGITAQIRAGVGLVKLLDFTAVNAATLSIDSFVAGALWHQAHVAQEV